MKKVNSVRRIVFTILAVTWMVVIFSFSARPGDESEEQSIKAGMMVCHVFVPGFDDLSEQQQIHMAQAIDHPVRKTAHATEYAMLAGLVLGAVTVSIIRWKNVLVSVCIAVLYASTDELHQLFVPGRSGQVKDVLIDGCGAVIGALIIWGISYLIHKNTESRNITRYVIANEILAMGNDIYILKKDYRTKKEKFDEDNRKSNEQYRRLKDRRKKIQNFAYADLISKIKSKIDSDNSGAVNEVTVSKDLYYYVHDEDKVNKSRFVDGIIAFKNRTCLEESYRALLIMNYDGKKYNRDMVEKGMSWIC